MSGQRRQPSWTSIEIPDNDSGANRNSAIELDLDAPLEDADAPAEKPNKNVNEESNQRPNPRPPVQKEEREEDDEARPQERANQEEEEVRAPVNADEPVRKQRAFKRIQQLSGEKNALIGEVQRLQQELARVQRTGQKASLDQAKANKELWANQVAEKKAALEAAIERNDPKAQAKIIEELTEAKTNHKVYSAVEQDLTGEEEERNARPQRQQVQQVNRQPQPEDLPEATQRWVERNPWFRSNGVLNTAARQAAQDLIEEGEDPTTEGFYKNLDTRLKENGIQVPVAGRQPPANQGRRSPVGSSADTDGEDFSGPGGPRAQAQFKRVGGRVQVTPTADDQEMADKMNVNIKDFMKEKYKYDSQGYKGYVTIDVPQ